MATGEGGLASCRVRAGALPVDDQPHAVEEARAGVEEGEDSSLPVGAAAEQEQREAANSQRDEDVVDGDVEEARDGAERGYRLDDLQEARIAGRPVREVDGHGEGNDDEEPCDGKRNEDAPAWHHGRHATGLVSAR